MDEMIRELYYMVEEWTGQGLVEDEEVKRLEEQRCALRDEAIHRIGEGGKELLEVISSLDLKLETIHDKALFRAGVRLGVELTRPEAGAATAAGP